MKIPFTNWEILLEKPSKPKLQTPQEIAKELVSKVVNTPTSASGARKSKPTGEEDFLALVNEKLAVIEPEFNSTIIGVIRSLTKENPDFGQAIKNTINLGNTGHKIKFDRTVSPEQVDAMRLHLDKASRMWAKKQGAAGMDGLVGRMIYQVMVSGALSLEKVISNDLKGLAHIPLVRPDNIRWVLDKRSGEFKPYEKLTTFKSFKNSKDVLNGDLNALNPNSYIYFGLYSDSEVPYGIPPYMTALKPTVTQEKMLDNIDFIVEQVGLIGFLQVLLRKEAKRDDENVNAYKSRMDNLLKEAANRIKESLRNGVNVGFQGDTEYEFHSATKSVSGVTDLFNTNELQLLSGLSMDGSLMGRNYGASESQITVVFMKMVSEFKAIQQLIKVALEDIYRTELLLAGYKFKYLSVHFKTSTLQDEVKWQQGQQYKIANTQEKYLSGWISQDQAADEMDYENPDQPEPRDIPNLAQKIVKQQERQKQKNQSAKESRKKGKATEKSPEDNQTRKKDSNS